MRFTTFDGYSWLYVLDDDERKYPIWYPAALFSVEDPRLPADWVFGYVRLAAEDDGYPVVSFPEWALDRHFYERLVDGDDEAQRVFEWRRITSEKH